MQSDNQCYHGRNEIGSMPSVEKNDSEKNSRPFYPCNPAEAPPDSPPDGRLLGGGRCSFRKMRNSMHHGCDPYGEQESSDQQPCS